MDTQEAVSLVSKILEYWWFVVFLVLGGFLGGLIAARSSLWARIESERRSRMPFWLERGMPQGVVRWWQRHRGRSHYLSVRNSVVRDRISDTSEFLDVFFGSMDGELVAPRDVGQIWLFNSDLAAFRSDVYFRRLYKEKALKWRSVEKVRVVLDPRLQPANATEVEERAKLARDWQLVWDNINREANVDKIVVCSRDDLKCAFPRLTKAFWDFVSDEAWVFYIRGDALEPNSQICIHRRFLGRGEIGPNGEPSDERITITASFGNSTHMRGRDPLKSFVKEKYLDCFQEIFNTISVAWVPLVSYTEQVMADLDATHPV